MPILGVWFGKGPVWQTFDRWFGRADERARLERKLEVLIGLHNSQRFTDMVHAPSTWSPAAVESLREHINADWFGLVPDGVGGWQRPGELDEPASAKGVGGWVGWRGDAEAVARETVIRAIEVSLGVEHHAWNPERPVTADDYGISSSVSPRNWPIEFWCTTPAPSFGAALAWRRDRDDTTRGLVTVVWFTPADGQTLTNEIAGDIEHFAVPTVADSRFGSWLIAQSTIDPIAVQTWTASARGEWLAPLPTLFAHGDVTTISPSLEVGGVDPDASY
jgi:hypothetical protein